MELKFIKGFILNEEIDSDNKLIRIRLTYPLSALDPILSEETMNYHYGKLYKTYVDKFNNNEGDRDFNEAGAFLHRLYFEQFKESDNTNSPTGSISDYIKEQFNDFKELREKFNEVAMSFQGSGWIYLSKNGQIKTIRNHAMRSDILLIIDWWEHSWALDYQADKSKYLKNIWKIIDWDVINTRLQK